MRRLEWRSHAIETREPQEVHTALSIHTHLSVRPSEKRANARSRARMTANLVPEGAETDRNGDFGIANLTDAMHFVALQMSRPVRLPEEEEAEEDAEAFREMEHEFQDVSYVVLRGRYPATSEDGLARDVTVPLGPANRPTDRDGRNASPSPALS